MGITLPVILKINSLEYVFLGLILLFVIFFIITLILFKKSIIKNKSVFIVSSILFIITYFGSMIGYNYLLDQSYEDIKDQLNEKYLLKANLDTIKFSNIKDIANGVPVGPILATLPSDSRMYEIYLIAEENEEEELLAYIYSRNEKGVYLPVTKTTTDSIVQSNYALDNSPENIPEEESQDK